MNKFSVAWIMFTNRLYLLLVSLLIITASCTKKETSTKSRDREVMQIEAFQVKSQPLDNLIRTSGNIFPNEKMELRSEISGRIEMLNFSEGSRITKGTLLVQIDDSELRAQIQKLQAQLRIATDDEARKKQLLMINGISQEIYDAALTRLEELEADIALVNSKIRKSKIEAPFSGTIGLRHVSEGAFVSAGEIIATLVQSDPVKVRFSIPEKYAGKIRNGMNIEFVHTGSDKIYKADIYASEPQIDVNNRTLLVSALTPNHLGELIPGSFAEITLNIERFDNALMVPTLTIIPLLNSQNVYVYKSGRVHLIQVETGIRNEKMIQVTGGLSEGDTIATTGLLALRDNMPVKVIKVDHQ